MESDVIEWQPRVFLRDMQIEELFDLYGERLYHYLSLKLGSSSDAEDVLQEVFCRLIRFRVRFRFIRHPAAFVFRVARNEAARFIRQKKRESLNIRNSKELTAAIQASFIGPDRNTLAQAAEALTLIPEEQREVIILKFFEELTFKEIASVCGVSLNTAASRYRYGIRRLRSRLESRDEQ